MENFNQEEMTNIFGATQPELLRNATSEELGGDGEAILDHGDLLEQEVKQDGGDGEVILDHGDLLEQEVKQDGGDGEAILDHGNTVEKEVKQDDRVMDTSMNGSSDLLKGDSPDKENRPIPLNAKGKEVVKDDSAVDPRMNEAPQFNEEGYPDTEICGICLNGTENEKGTLDCCKHVFCHECIMTWARKETSCPICKQRFVTVTVNPRKSDSSGISATPRTQKTSFRIPQRDLFDNPEGVGRNYQLAITKPEPKNLNLFIQEAAEKYKGETHHLNLMLKLRVELMCGRCGAMFLDQTLDVNVGRNVRLPLDHWPWACLDCSLEFESDDSDIASESDWDFDFDVLGLPHVRMSEGGCRNLGLTTLITMSRISQESGSSSSSSKLEEASTSHSVSPPNQVISIPADYIQLLDRARKLAHEGPKEHGE